MKGLLLLLAFAISMPQVKADPFIRDDIDTSSKFHSNLSDFGRSLDDASRMMRSDYDYHNSMNAQQQRAFNDAMQADTGAASQQMFQASQMQAASSGGLYNGNGSNNMGIGGYAIVPVTTLMGAQAGAVPYGAQNPTPGPFANPYAPQGNQNVSNNVYQQSDGFTWGIGSSSSGTVSSSSGSSFPSTGTASSSNGSSFPSIGTASSNSGSSFPSSRATTGTTQASSSK
jgi:hypothetical protein